jgi:KUP system potassium uptake protein
MASCGEVPKVGRPKDFKFVILERFLSYDNEFSAREGFILNTYFSILRLARSDSRAYGIDSDQAVVEKVPLVLTPLSKIQLRRVRR